MIILLVLVLFGVPRDDCGSPFAELELLDGPGIGLVVILKEHQMYRGVITRMNTDSGQAIGTRVGRCRDDEDL